MRRFSENIQELLSSLKQELCSVYLIAGFHLPFGCVYNTTYFRPVLEMIVPVDDAIHFQSGERFVQVHLET